MDKNRKRRWGDRYDGWKVRSLDLFFPIIPQVMRSRLDCQNTFEEVIEITELEKWIRKMRKETEMTSLSLLHVVAAAAMRMVATRPCVNRFVSGRKIYARNDISFVMSVKKEMSLEGSETSVKMHFEPYDTLTDVWQKMNETVSSSKLGNDNSTDTAAKIIGRLPGFLLKFIVWAARNLDHIGLLPKAVNEVSPFHASMVLVDIGSTGIDSVYHHLYEFGTCSLFMVMGKKKTIVKRLDDGTIGAVRAVSLKFTIDERICDGFYFANSLRNFKKLLKDPDCLMVPPENITEDPGLLI